MSDEPEPVVETSRPIIRKKKVGWQKGKSRKPQTDALKEIERRIELASFLSNEEKAEARQRARDHVAKKRKDKAIDQFFEAAVRAEEEALQPEEHWDEITIDLPEYTYQIVINGTAYYHGVTYKLKISVIRSMLDIQACAWAHQREIDGRRRMGDINRRPELTHSVGGNINTRGAMRL